MKKNKSYVVKENGDIPDWLDERMRMGKVGKVLDIDGDFMHYKVMSPTKTYNAYVGDEIILTSNGLIVKHKEVKENG